MTAGRIVVSDNRHPFGLRRTERFRWTLLAANGEPLCRSTEGYADLQECVRIASRCMGGIYADVPIILPNGEPYSPYPS